VRIDHAPARVTQRIAAVRMFEALVAKLESQPQTFRRTTAKIIGAGAAR
jgi:hypothetical protein